MISKQSIRPYHRHRLSANSHGVHGSQWGERPIGYRNDLIVVERTGGIGFSFRTRTHVGRLQ